MAVKVDIVIKGSQATSQHRCVYSCKEKKTWPPWWHSVEEIPGVHIGANANESSGQQWARGPCRTNLLHHLLTFVPIRGCWSGVWGWRTVWALFHRPGTTGWGNQAAGEIGVLSGRQVSTCWISREHFPKDLGWYFRIFWRVLGQIFPSATHRPPPLRLHKSAVDCRKKKDGVSLESNGNVMRHPKLSWASTSFSPGVWHNVKYISTLST